jgi:hypothetical protein
MAKASKKPAPKKESKYHKRIKIEGTPDEVLKKMLQSSIKKKDK